jgi:hypothetical protein
MGWLRDCWHGLPWETFDYRIIRRPYGAREWQYFVQYFYRGQWRTTQRSVYDCHFDDSFWSEKAAREEIIELKRGHESELVAEVK